MDMAPFKMLLVDAAAHSLLLTDGPSGEILSETFLPTGLTPVEVAVSQSGRTYIPCTSQAGNGALLALSIADLSLNRLPHLLPAPNQFVLSPEGTSAFLADTQGLLYAINPSDTTPTLWGKPPGALECAGLATDNRGVYGAWLTSTGGIIAYFNHSGTLAASFSIDGNPTFLTLDPVGRLFITFSTANASGEGLIIAARHSDPLIIPLLCSRCAGKIPLYPSHLSISPDGKSAFAACEDSAGIAVFDLEILSVSDYINLGRSVSRIHLIADSNFAIASSNAFADLCLVDLVNRRLLSFSATPRELLSPLAIIN